MNEWFIMLLIAGLMLIGAEVFIPGGVLGVVGALALMTAAVIGFSLFPPVVALMIAAGMIVLVGVVIALWIRIFPHTSIGKQMIVMRSFKDIKGTDSAIDGLVGKVGTTRSVLRPAGFIEVENRRIDVVTEGEMIECNVPVRIIAVEGNHVIVEALPSPDAPVKG